MTVFELTTAYKEQAEKQVALLDEALAKMTVGQGEAIVPKTVVDTSLTACACSFDMLMSYARWSNKRITQ